MKHLFAAAIAVGLVVTGTSRAQFGPGPKYEPSEVTALVDQVHTDLNHAWAKGKFDKDQLDGVIGSIQHVLDNNKLPVDERDAISKDLTQLRNMRTAYDHHEIGGVR